MPLFGKKKKDILTENQISNDELQPPSYDSIHPGRGGTNTPTNSPKPKHQVHSSPATPIPATTNPTEGAAVTATPKPKLVFYCQQAQGSPTGIISGFTNLKELYQKIAECYEIPVSEILYCTLNTHKVDMGRLLGGQIGLDDFIFAHRKGQAKEIEVTKNEETLGLTITDNGAGYAFIKRIKEGSVMDRMPSIQVGDHIEKINDRSLVGSRHFEVAKMLKEISKGTNFVLRVVEPLRAGFANIGPRGGGPTKKSTNFGSGKETLRLRSKGPATVEDAPDEIVEAAVEKINGLLETFMGINDVELSRSIWDLGQGKTNTHDFALAVDESDLGVFGFTDDFIFDLWGAIGDAKAGRLKKENADIHF